MTPGSILRRRPAKLRSTAAYLAKLAYDLRAEGTDLEKDPKTKKDGEAMFVFGMGCAAVAGVLKHLAKKGKKR